MNKMLASMPIPVYIKVLTGGEIWWVGEKIFERLHERNQCFWREGHRTSHDIEGVATAMPPPKI